jgi:hypothetical protein
VNHQPIKEHNMEQFTITQRRVYSVIVEANSVDEVWDNLDDLLDGVEFEFDYIEDEYEIV